MWIPPAYSPVPPTAVFPSLLSGEAAIWDLEAKLSEWYFAERALATGSGTEALQLAMKVARESRGGKGRIALPAYNCYDLVAAAVWVDAPVVFYDVDPLTLSPDPGSLHLAAARSTVLVVANLFGFPLDWDLIREVGNEHGVAIVEDAAQGLGAKWKGRQAGTLGDLSVLSFGRGKGWIGEGGGALLARGGTELRGVPPLLSPPSHKTYKALKLLGVWLLSRPNLYGIPMRIPFLRLGQTRYSPPKAPSRITIFSAAFVTRSRQRAVEEVVVRQQNRGILKNALEQAQTDWELPRPVPGGVSGDLRFPVLIPGGRREDKRLGLYAGYPLPLPSLEAARGILTSGPPTPGSSRLAKCLATLPTHSRTPTQVLTRYLLHGAFRRTP